MDKIIVQGGRRLKGSVKAEGAKNAVLPVIAATLLAEEGRSTLYDVPPLADVDTISNVLRHVGTEVNYEAGDAYMIGPGHDAWITSAEGTEAYEVSFDKADIWHD